MAVILALGIMAVALLAVVYVLTGQIVLRWIVEHFRKPKAPVMRAQRIYRLSMLGLTLLSLSCLAYGHFIEPYWLEVTNVRIVSPKMPRSCRPVRIVQISDLHCEAQVRLEDRLPGIIAEQKPDAIVFTGDAANDLRGVPTFRNLMRALSRIAPTFAVRGNWDDWNPDLYDGTGVRELNREFVKLDVKGADVYLLGIGATYNPQPSSLAQKVPPQAVKVLLYHFPDILAQVSSAPNEQLDLILSGHTHGGQVALPFYGALYIPSRLGKLLERGLYVHGQTYLYVNRGIGMEGGSTPRVRFLSRPEVSVIDIAPPS
jgi:predicted MPP superfamily phosphohydrolase